MSDLEKQLYEITCDVMDWGSSNTRTGKSPERAIKAILTLIEAETRQARRDEAYIAAGGEFITVKGEYYKSREVLRDRLAELKQDTEGAK